MDSHAEMTRKARRPLIWTAALLTFGVTVLLVVLIGLSTGVGAAIYLPLALGFGIVLAGLPVAYLLPGDEDESSD
ncbi:MAG TPA: hypothetical protein VI316_06765 [Candidatus Dormibacteraeota bacterium]